jgi:hypothetical protein
MSEQELGHRGKKHERTTSRGRGYSDMGNGLGIGSIWPGNGAAAW